MSSSRCCGPPSYDGGSTVVRNTVVLGVSLSLSFIMLLVAGIVGGNWLPMINLGAIGEPRRCARGCRSEARVGAWRPFAHAAILNAQHPRHIAPSCQPALRLNLVSQCSCQWRSFCRTSWGAAA